MYRHNQSFHPGMLATTRFVKGTPPYGDLREPPAESEADQLNNKATPKRTPLDDPTMATIRIARRRQRG